VHENGVTLIKEAIENGLILFAIFGASAIVAKVIVWLGDKYK
jgi:16S rRNA C1402 (ribose-2'-O) methylase RsmI